MAEGFIARHQLWSPNSRTRRPHPPGDRGERAAAGPDRLVRPARHPAREDPGDPALPLRAAPGQGLPDRHPDLRHHQQPGGTAVRGLGAGRSADDRAAGRRPGTGPLTFRVLPWLTGTGWILSEMHYRSGERVPFDTRGVLKDQLGRLAEEGFEYVSGIEMEFYLTKLEDPMLSFETAATRRPRRGSARSGTVPVPDRVTRRRDRADPEHPARQPGRARTAAVHD